MHRKHLIKALGLSALAIVSVMAVSVSAAQAEYRLLLNGASVASVHHLLEFLPGYLEAENTLKVECKGGEGEDFAELKESNKKVIGTAKAALTGCIWSKSEKVCQIVSEKGEKGVIEAAGEGELTMKNLAGTLEQNEYRIVATSANFTTIITEDLGGCTIPEEETISGTLSLLVLEALASTVVKLEHLNADNIKLGNSKVKALVGEVHSRDMNLPTRLPSGATLSIHLCNLAGNPAC